jgi:hypothetical protein
MPHTSSNRRKPAAPAALVLLLACLGLAACGSSSNSSSTATSTNAAAATSASSGTTTGPAGQARGQFGKRFSALRECLRKNGITLPERTPGQRRSGGPGGFLGGGAGGPQLPKGVTRAQYAAALKKCGGGAFTGGGGARFSSPAFKQALTKFSACMRENGVNVPAPNTSGKGPIFSTKGLNTSSPQFRVAETKCSKDLRSTFRRGSGARGEAPPSGPPPAGAGG